MELSDLVMNGILHVLFQASGLSSPKRQNPFLLIAGGSLGLLIHFHPLSKWFPLHG